MSLPPSNALDREKSATVTERRIRLLVNIAAAQAELGRIEEVMQACKIIARLRDKVTTPGAGPAVREIVPRPSQA